MKSYGLLNKTNDIEIRRLLLEYINKNLGINGSNPLDELTLDDEDDKQLKLKK